MGLNKIYREIAQKNGVTVAQLKRDIQEAINQAYIHSPNDGVTKAYQNRIPRKGECDEFILYVDGEIKNKNNSRWR